MSKTIKVSEVNHAKLEALMKPRESFDDVVNRLLDTWEQAGRLLDALEGGTKLREAHHKQFLEAQKTH